MTLSFDFHFNVFISSWLSLTLVRLLFMLYCSRKYIIIFQGRTKWYSD